MNKNNKNDLVTLKDYTREEIMGLISKAGEVKDYPGKYGNVLKGKNIALLFNKYSTRTRLSLEVGINQMGGNVIYLDAGSLQLVRGEDYSDTAKIFSGYLDGVVIRTFEHKTVEIFASDSKIPVINGLTDSFHPCQALSDLFTLKELGMLGKGCKFTYMGDSNNVTNSLMVGFSKLGIPMTVCSPHGYSPNIEILDYCNSLPEACVKVENDPVKGAEDANVIYTDVWISMGDKNCNKKMRSLMPYQVNEGLLGYAADEVKIMHCLPAHRGEEITAEVMDSIKSVIFAQAENRLHAQKALLSYIYM